MIKKNWLMVRFFKKSLFAIIAFVLILFWKGIFILQGAISLEGNLLLLPVKLLPILLYSFFTFWLFLKMFDYKHKISKKRQVALVASMFSLTISLIFQYSITSKRTGPFIFKNKMFSHVEPIKSDRDFKNRMMLSAAEYLRLMPLGAIDNEFTSYIANATAEAALIFELKKLIDDQNIKNTCKKFIANYGDYNACITSFQKDIYSHYNFTSAGNILLAAIGALGTFEVKELLIKQYGDKDFYVFIKSMNDIIETSMFSVQRSKNYLSNKSSVIRFSMGQEMAASSISGTLERQINYKLLMLTIDRISGFVSKVDEKSLIVEKGNQKREVSSATVTKLEKEKIKFEKYKKQLYSFQNGEFKIEDLKKKHKEMNREMEIMLKKVKKESFLFKVAGFFNKSLYELSADDLLKDRGLKKTI